MDEIYKVNSLSDIVDSAMHTLDSDPDSRDPHSGTYVMAANESGDKCLKITVTKVTTGLLACERYLSVLVTNELTGEKPYVMDKHIGETSRGVLLKLLVNLLDARIFFI